MFCVSAFLFLFSNWIFTTASLALTHERVPNYKPLPDVTLDAVTTQEWGLDVSEIIIMITVYLCVMVLLFHKHRLVRTNVHYQSFYFRFNLALTNKIKNCFQLDIC